MEGPMKGMGPPPSPEFLAANQGSRVYVACAITMTISTFFYICRMISRYITKVRFTLSDGILLLGLLFSYALAGCYIWTAKIGAGRHTVALIMEDPTTASAGAVFKAFFVATLVYFTAISLVKISILAVYYELFGSVRYTKTLWIIGGVVVAWWLAFTLQNILGCQPIQAGWSLIPIPGSHCINAQPAFWVNGVTNVLTDVVIVLLPVRVVWTMQLNKRSKLGLVFVFLLGALVCIASAIRLGLSSNGDMDFIYGMVLLEVWSEIELCVAIACACLLTMRPLFRLLIPDFISQAISRRSTRSRSRVSGRHLPKSGPLASAGRASKHMNGGVRLDTYPAGVGTQGEARKTSTRSNTDVYAETYDSLGDTIDEGDPEKGGPTTIRVTRGFMVHGGADETDLEHGRGHHGGKGEGESLGDERGSLNASTRELFPKD